MNVTTWQDQQTFSSGVKDVTYRMKIYSVLELKKIILASIETISSVMLQCSWVKLKYHY